MGNLFSLSLRVFSPDASGDKMNAAEDTWLEIETVSNENHSQKEASQRKRSKNANKYIGKRLYTFDGI